MTIYDEPIYRNNSQLAKLVSVECVNNGHTFYVTITNISLKGHDRFVPASMESFGLTRRFKLEEFYEDHENAKRYLILKQSKPKANLRVQVSFNDLMKVRNCMEKRQNYMSI